MIERDVVPDSQRFDSASCREEIKSTDFTRTGAVCPGRLHHKARKSWRLHAFIDCHGLSARMAAEKDMQDIGHYSFLDRQRAKEASRARDESDLRNDHVSREELRAANGVFSSLDIAASSIRRRV
ncbi:MAG: hypothetical protein AB7U35_10665 [Sphingobium sp.]